MKKFEMEYGKKKGDYVYGATVGKVKREREGRANTAEEIKRKAINMAYDGNPIKLVAMKRRPDGLFYNYVQSFNNQEAANRAAAALRNEGYHVGIVT